MLIGLGFGLLAVGGCSELNLVECEDGSSCPSSHRCERGEQSFICLAEDAAVRCQKTYPEDLLDQLEDPNRADEYILIGTIFDRSDSLMKKYEPIVEFALKQANQAGGVAGRQFGAVFCTVESDVALNYDGHTLSTVAAQQVVDHLVDDLGVQAVIGGGSSSVTKAAFESRGGARDLLIMSPSATSPVLTKLDSGSSDDETPGLLWRTAPPDIYQGRAIAYDMRRDCGASDVAASGARCVESAAVVYVNDPYGEGLYGIFKEEFGGTVDGYGFDEADGPDEAIDAAGMLAVDEILFISANSDHIRRFLERAEDDDFRDKTVFLTEMAATREVLLLAPESVHERVRGSRPRVLATGANKPYAAFIAGYEADYDENLIDEIFTANTYDAAWLVSYGVAWAALQEDTVSAESIARGLRQLSDTGARALDVGPDSWPMILDEFRAGRSVNIQGASGALDYDLADEELSAEIEIWSLDENLNILVDYNWSASETVAAASSASPSPGR